MAKRKKANKNVSEEENKNVADTNEGIENEAGENENAGVNAEGNDVKVEIVGDETASNGSEEELDDQLLMLQEMQKLKAQAEESRNQYLRLMAEFDNFRKRTRREFDSFREYASEGVLKALLPVLDDFNRTMEAMEKTDNLTSLKEGVTLVNDKLFRVLEKEGLKSIDAKGQPFDVEFHEAIHSVPVPEEDQKGLVLEEVETGYRLKDKVIRYSKVVVGE